MDLRKPILQLALLVVFLGAIGAGTTPAPGDDHILDRLSREPAVYLWSNDVPGLLKTLETMCDIRAEEAEKLWRVDEADDSPGNQRELAPKDELDDWQVLELIWSQLREEQVFDGQAAVVLFLDPSNTNRPRHRLAFIAESSSKDDDVNRFIANIERLHPKRDLLAPISILGKAPLTPCWSFEQGWFTWSNDRATHQSLCDLLTERKVAIRSMSSDRTFQQAFKEIDNPLNSRPSISMYATGEMLPLFGSRLVKELEWVSNVNLGTWNSLFLNEIRGFGMKVYLDEPKLVEETRARVAMDSFLVVTTPRHGFLRGLGGRSNQEIDFRVPIPSDAELGRFSQFNLDPTETYAGVLELQQREQQKGDALRDWEGRNTAELSVWQFIQCLCSVSYRPSSNRMEGGHRELSFVQTAASNAEKEKIAKFIEQLELNDEETRPSTNRELSETKIVSANELEKDQRDTLNALGASFEANYDYLIETRGGYDHVFAKQPERQRVSELCDAIRNNRAFRPGDWLLIGNDSEDSIRSQGDRLEQHQQLAKLESLIKKLRNAFDSKAPLCGTVAIWTGGFYQRVNDFENSMQRQTYIIKSVKENVNPTIASFFAPHELNANERRQAAIARRLIGQFIDTFIVAIAVDEDGFRIQGVIAK